MSKLSLKALAIALLALFGSAAIPGGEAEARHGFRGHGHHGHHFRHHHRPFFFHHFGHRRHHGFRHHGHRHGR